MMPALDLAGDSSLSDEERREAIVREARRISHLSADWADAYRSDAEMWKLLNLYLMIIAAVLAAITSCAALASLLSPKTVGIIALVSAAVSATAGALGGATRATQSQSTAAANLNLADDCDAFVKTEANFERLPHVITRWSALCDKRDAIVSGAPATRSMWLKHAKERASQKRK